MNTVLLFMKKVFMLSVCLVGIVVLSSLGIMMINGQSENSMLQYIGFLGVVVIGIVLTIYITNKLRGKRIGKSEQIALSNSKIMSFLCSDSLLIKWIIVISLGILIRVFVLYAFSLEQEGDYWIYLKVGQLLNDKQPINSLYYGIFPHALHYPQFLSWIYSIFGFSMKIIKLMNLFFAGLEITACFLIVSRYVDKKHLIKVSLLIVLNPVSVFSILFTGGETIYSSLIIIAIYIMLLKNTDRTSLITNPIVNGIVLGVVLGLANYFRPTAVIMLIALGLYTLLFEKDLISKRIIRMSAVIIMFMLVNTIFSGMTEANNSYGQPDNSVGWNLYIGAGEEYEGVWNIADGQVFINKIDELGDPDLIQTFFFEQAIRSLWNTIKIRSYI